MTTVHTAPAAAATPARAAVGDETKPRGPLPLIVGVTGHRDLRAADLPALETLVREVIAEVREQYPHTPLIVLSPLAEGSDRLVARVGHALGARLHVPLPLPLALYERDFVTSQSREEFRTLLALADKVYEMPIAPGNTVDGIATHGDQRNRQYAQVGAFIALHSQVFLALWDGVPKTADTHPGGTADIVKFRLEGAPGRYEPVASPLQLASIGTVHHVITPREGAPLPPHALTRTRLVPARQRAEDLDDLPRWMDRFNEDVLDHPTPLARGIEQSKAQLLHVEPSQLEAELAVAPASARATLEHYAIADVLALRFAREARGATWRLYLIVFIAALFFNLFHSLPQGHVPEDPTLVDRLLGLPWLLLLFLGTSLVGSLWVHRRAEEEDFQNKHQDYRALAEALRIQFFWQVAGLPDAVVDHYLRKQRGALEWIRNALRAWDVESARGRSPEIEHAPLTARVIFVALHWVTEQRTYYANRARREQRTLESERRRTDLLVGSSLVLSLLLALGLSLPLLVPVHALEGLRHAIEEPWTHGIVMVTIVTLAVVAGLRHGYGQQMAYSEHAKQFGRMAELFDTAERHLAQLLTAGEPHRAAALLRDLGEEALEENGDWVLLHRERPLEVPHSG